MVHPELHLVLDGAAPPALRAIYGSPAPRIGQRLFAKLVNRTLDEVADRFEGAVPADERERRGLAPLGQALRSLHNPPNDAAIGDLNACRTAAHRALAFDEMFAFQLALAIERYRAAERAGIAHRGEGALTSKFLAMIPFRPTNSQSRAIAEIENDMAGARQMNRMLMGDVGSGKTVVALWAALRAVECGHQAAFMAPTELLAEQHYRTFEKLGASLGVVAGSERQSNRGQALGPAQGSRQRSDSPGFRHSRVDSARGPLSQSQPGDNRRAAPLRSLRAGSSQGLGPRADMLLMTATPIPRSLTHTLFANLDLSLLDELPAGRAADRDADLRRG